MRYTLTNKAIAVLLSLVLLIGSASGIIEIVEDDSLTEMIDITDASDTHESVDGVIAIDISDINETYPTLPPTQSELDGDEDKPFTELLDIYTPENGNDFSNESYNDENSNKHIASLDLKIDLALLDLQTDFVSLAGHRVFFGVEYGLGILTIAYGGEEANSVEDEEFPSLIPTGHTITVTAAPNSGWRVESWGGALDGEDPDILEHHVTVNTDIEVTVIFEQAVYPVSFGIHRDSADGGGSISQPSSTGMFDWGYNNGIYESDDDISAAEEITFTANHNPGFFVGHWYINGTVVRTGGNTFISGTPARTGDTHVEVEFLRGRAVRFDVFPDNIGLSAVDMTVSYTLGSIVNEPLAYIGGTPPAAPTGATINFTAPPAPYGFNFYSYEWRVGDDVQTGQTDQTFSYPNLQEDINVTVTLVRGVDVAFSAINGTISAAGGSPVSSDDITIRENTPITFTAAPNSSINVFEYEWRVGINGGPMVLQTGAGANGTTFTYNPSAPPAVVNEIVVEAIIIPGYNVEFGLAATEESTAGTVRAWVGAVGTTEVTDNPAFLRAGTNLIFAIEPSTAHINSAVTWTPPGGTASAGVPGPPEIPPGRTYTINNLSSDLNVRATFVSFNLSATTVNVIGIGTAFIDPSTITATGSAGGDMVLNPVDLANIATNAPGLLITVSGDGNSINVNSVSGLTYAHNGTYTVRVVRQDVERTITIIVAIPYLEVLGPDVIDINNANLSGSITIRTNAEGGISFNPDFVLAGLTGFTYTFAPHPEGLPFEELWLLTITGLRPEEGEQQIIFPTPPVTSPGTTMSIHRGGVSAPFRLTVNLTPPPRIDTITPTSATVQAFSNVSVHGSPPGAADSTPPGIINAEFSITGVALNSGANQENAAEVINSIGLGTLPNWITLAPGTTIEDIRDNNITIHNATSATVTVPLIVLPNRVSTDPSFDELGRRWMIDATTGGTVITTSLTNSSGVVGRLIVSQGGPISLDPSTVTLTTTTTPSNLSETVIVRGSGDIEIIQTSLDALEPNVRNNLTFSIGVSEGLDTLTVTATRPAEENILGIYTVTVTRDGLNATLTLDLNIEALDRPTVQWPNAPTHIFTARFGRLLSEITITGGSAHHPGVASTPVPGTFTWSTPTDPVGTAGAIRQHLMTFTPNDRENYAVVTATLPVDTGTNLGSVNVLRAIPEIETLPVITWPVPPTTTPATSPTATFGQTLGLAGFTGGLAINPFNTTSSNTVLGNFAWTTPSVPVGNPGERTHEITFTPDDPTNFESVTETVTITVSRADQVAPAAPTAVTLDGITAESITLNNITNSVSGVNVQFIRLDEDRAPTEIDWVGAVQYPNLTFTGLDPFTNYYFFARYPGYPGIPGSNYNTSPVSPVGTIRTLRAALGGTPTINGSFAYQGTLTANINSLYANPPGNNTQGLDFIAGLAASEITYVWNRIGGVGGNATIGINSPTYTLTADDIGATITVTVTTTATNNPVISEETVPIARRVPVYGDLTYNLDAVTFNGSSQSVAVTGPTGIGVIGGITVQYRLSGLTNESDWNAIAPTNAGSYQVRAVIDDAGSLYTAATVELPGVFTINKATPELTDLIITFPGASTSGIVTWSPGFSTPPPGNPPVATAVSTLTSGWIGAITVEYSLDGGTTRTPYPPQYPGTVTVFLNIAEGTNFAARSDFDGVPVGTYSIQGTDIPDLDITVNGVNVTVDVGVSFVYNRNDRNVTVSDSGGGTVYFSLTAGGPWLATTDPQFNFRNVTPLGGTTVYFRIIRHDTGFNPYYGETTITITPHQLTWATYGSVASKVYNRSLDATITTNPTLSAIFPGDTVTVSVGSAAFATWNVDPMGLPVAVNATGTWSIGGASAGNYLAPTSPPSFNPAIITAKPITITGVTATNRDYDALNTVALTGGTLVGVEPGDTVDFTLGNGTMINSDIGNNKAVTTTITLTGDDAGNYTLTQPTGITVNIAPKTLTISSVTATNRAYNGLTTVALTGGSLVGVETSDSAYVSFTLGNGTIVSANADNGKPVTTSIVLTGTRAANYTLTQPTGITVDITRVTLTPSISFSGVSGKVYDGTPAIIGTLPTIILTGAVNNESPQATATFAFEDADVGVNKNVTASSITLTGSWGANYTLSTTSLTHASGANINRRPITGAANIDVLGPFSSLGQIQTGTVLEADISSIIGVPGSPSVPLTLSFQWYRQIGDDPPQAIPGAIGDTYTIGTTAVDPVGANITVRITGSYNYIGVLDASPVEVGLIPISGDISIDYTTLLVSDELTLIITDLDPPDADIAITWLRDGIPIAGATNPIYEITQDDHGRTLTVVVVGIAPYTGSLSENIVIPAIVPNAPLELTAIPGDTQVTLAWSEPDFDGGSAVTDYHIFISNDAGDTWIDVDDIDLFTPFSTLAFASYDIGLFTPLSTAPDTTRVVTGLTNGTEYIFRVHAVNDIGRGDHVETTATPVPPPRLTSIMPTPATIALFSNIPEDGLVEDAVFEAVGTDLTAQAVLGANAFAVSEFPAWARPSNLRVEYLDSTKATVTVTLTTMPNPEVARSGNIEIGNTITGAITGILTVSQDEATPTLATFQVTILNSPNGAAVISGQSEAVRAFKPGETVSLIAGTRDGFTFINWSTASQGVTLDNASNTVTNFTMPSHNVIITANWTEDEQQESLPEPPPEQPSEQPPGPPPRSPPEPVPASSLENDSGDSIETEHTINSGAEGDTGLGEDSGSSGTTSQVTGNSAPPSGNPTSGGDAGSGAGFGTWLRSNLWWILLVVGAVAATVTSLIIVLRKRMTKRPLIANSGDT
jgi:uncharacterized repeat protein (TIGR02543 family)